MKELRQVLLLLLLAMPLTALAHGEEILETVFLEFIVVMIIAIGLFVTNLNKKGKLLVGGIFILTTLLTNIFIDSFPYNQYRTLINIVVVTVPLTIGVASYFLFKNKFRKE